MRPIRSARSAGFTLIELLVVIGIVGLLAATLLPSLVEGKEAANIAADEANLREHYKWQQLYATKQKVGHAPTEGGHRLLLDVWVRCVVEHTPTNLDRFFTPGLREADARYIELRERVLRKEPIWTTLQETTSLDTHYAARATPHLAGMMRGTEAIAADDNETTWSFASGTVNVLYGDASVRPLSLQRMMDQFGWPGLDSVFPTFGPASPDPDLKKLAN